MWLRIRSGERIVDPRMWSPMCSALLMALLLDPEVARAGDDLSDFSGSGGLVGSTSLLERVMPAHENLEALADQRRAAQSAVASPRPIRAFPLTAAPGQPGGPSPAFSTSAAASEQVPIRLDARAVLGLNDLFVDPWRASRIADAPLFQSSGPRIRQLEFGVSDTEIASARKRLKEYGLGTGTGWFGEHVELNFNDGVAYRENFEWRGMHLRLKIWGPVLKGDPGLGMRLRGLQVSGYPVEVRARATTDLQDVQVRIDF